MLSISRFALRPVLEWAAVGATLLSLVKFRAATVANLPIDGLNEHLRRDIGLLRHAAEAGDANDGEVRMYRYNGRERSVSYRLFSARGKADDGFVTRLTDVGLAWLERMRERRDLAELDDRMLRDIGLNRADVERETSQWFWQLRD